MSWLRAFGYVALAALLAAGYFATAPPPRPSGAAPASTPSHSGPAIASLRLEADGRTIRAVRSGEHWQVVEPAGSAAPGDLVSALVSAVLDAPAEPVSSSTQGLDEFGLDTPTARLIFDRPDAPPVTLTLGSTNPAETGVYGRLEGNPQVVLLGLNVRYYVDLLLKQSAAPNAGATG